MEITYIDVTIFSQAVVTIFQSLTNHLQHLQNDPFSFPQNIKRNVGLANSFTNELRKIIYSNIYKCEGTSKLCNHYLQPEQLNLCFLNNVTAAPASDTKTGSSPLLFKM